MSVAGFAITAPDKGIDAVLVVDADAASAAYARLQTESKWPESVTLWKAWLFNYGERGAYWEPRTESKEGEI